MSERLPTRLRSLAVRSANLLIMLVMIAAAAAIPIGAALGIL